MDKHDFGAAGASNSAFVGTNFGPPRKPPAPHYIDTTQQPEDTPDRSFEKQGMFSATMLWLVLPGAAIALAAAHFTVGFPF